ncbi:MAG: NAD(P)H-hydrate dehydratase [Cytophagales bacterium]
MRILNSEIAKQWEAYTIEKEQITVLDLMHRACEAFVERFIDFFTPDHGIVKIFSGLGNNGADGVLIARLLSEKMYSVELYVIRYTDETSKEFDSQIAEYEKLHPVYSITSEYIELNIEAGDIVIDALFGTGLNRPLPDLCNSVIRNFNSSGALIVSVDMPSGLKTDDFSANSEIVNADFTFTFQAPKLSAFLPSTGRYYGELHVIDIGLLEEFWDEQMIDTPLTIQGDEISLMLKPRQTFSHKGTYGHVLVASGSQGFAGAAILTTKAALVSGAGLVTSFVPKNFAGFIHNSVPEALVLEDDHEKRLTEFPRIEKYSSIALGPGIGTHEETAKLVYKFLKKSHQTLVIDADAINILAEHKDWLELIPTNSIFTPHPKELERLLGRSENEFERLNLMKHFTKTYQCYCLVKGAYTCVCCPDGEVYFNTTGNAAMAKGGSGDVLTGVIAGLLAQGYHPKQAVLIAVYWHGLAGDIAAEFKSEQSVLATDIINCMGTAYKRMFEE